ncbi:Nuclear import receptor [Microbotryomycetes sp. JL221]|nr:Nuclear import receptor [Microbotryomycetes sp. JL221]
MVELDQHSLDINFDQLDQQLNSDTVPLALRFRALFTLKNVGGPRAIEIIGKGFDGQSALLGHELAYCLGQIKDIRALPILETVLNDDNQHPMVRHEAAEAMGAISDPSSLPTLRQYLNHDNVSIRETAEIAIAKIEWDNSDKPKQMEPNAFNTIDPAPASSNHSPLTASTNQSTMSIQELQNTLMNKQLPLFERYRAMFALRNNGSTEAVLALATGFKDDSALFRHEIAYVFGQLSSPDSVPSLIQVLNHSQEEEMVRHEAAEALGGIATDECLPVLKKFANDESCPRVVRESCQVALDMLEASQGFASSRATSRALVLMSHPSTPLGGPTAIPGVSSTSYDSGASTPTSVQSTTTASLEQVVQALNVLYHGQDNQAREQANEWLRQFQKSQEAWATAQLILFAPDAPTEPKLFAAQTFRQKITYDLDQLPETQLVPLRDSILSALTTMFQNGPKIIQTQLCLSLADLALQMTSNQWSDPIGNMIELKAQDPNQASILLEFLQVMAEEYSHNMRIQVNNDFGAKGTNAVERGQQVVGLLSMYVQAPAWLRTGQIAANSIAGSAMLQSCFDSLENEDLFDSSVDCLCDLIHETQELQDNVEIIQEIVSKLLPLKQMVLNQHIRQDEDKMRGYTRILVEAGEWYEQLIVQHQESFVPLVEAIAACATHEDLEIVGITLGFWYRLARGFRHARSRQQQQDVTTTTAAVAPIEPIVNVLKHLVTTIIGHLHYPQDDQEPLTGQDRDNFREFRHKIGDTLKDCCSMLGATNCMTTSFDMITSTLTKSASNGGQVRWQDIEAPLFSMRTMGAEVDPNDNQVMPRIMDLIPNLPNHPKIRYASTLVIGRYTQWIDYHPESIQFVLPFIIQGFEFKDEQISAAAAQALKYLCKDCSIHLINFLQQLHHFLQTVSNGLNSQDLLELSEAVAHVVSQVQIQDRPQAIGLFVMPNVEVVHTLNQKYATSTTTTTATTATAGGAATPSKQELRLALDALERIDVMLSIVSTDDIVDQLPEQCHTTCQQTWIILDQFLSNFLTSTNNGFNSELAEKTCIVIRRGLQFFGQLIQPLTPNLIERMTISFEKSGASSFLWITSRTIETFAFKREPSFLNATKSAFERQCAKVFTMLQMTTPTQMQDVLEDFTTLFNCMMEFTPDLILLSPSLTAAFQICLTTLTLYNPPIVHSALDAIRSIVGHECLQFDSNHDSNLNSTFQPLFSEFSNQIKMLMSSSLLLPLEKFDPTLNFDDYNSEKVDQKNGTLTPLSQPTTPGLVGSSSLTLAGSTSSSTTITTGTVLITLLLHNLIESHEDLTSNVLTLFRLLSMKFSELLNSNVLINQEPGSKQGLNVLNDKIVSFQDRILFVQKYQTALASGNPNSIKDAFTWLMRSSRRTRERSRFADDRR